MHINLKQMESKSCLRSAQNHFNTTYVIARSTIVVKSWNRSEILEVVIVLRKYEIPTLFVCYPSGSVTRIVSPIYDPGKEFIVRSLSRDSGIFSELKKT